jgi:type I restriction enzyme S subunit
VLKVSAVGDGVFIPTESKALLQQEDFDPLVAVRDGDLLVTRANASLDGVARVCVVNGDHPNLMLSDKTWRLHLHDGPWTAEFVMHLMQLPGFRRHVEQKAGGTGARNISQQKLLDGPVPVPSPEASARARAWLSAVSGSLNGCSEALAAIRELLKTARRELL